MYMEEMNKVARECMLIAAMQFNARYAALNFYQQRKDKPLTDAEIKEIVDGLDSDMNRLAEDMYWASPDRPS